MTNAVQISIK